MVMDLYGRDDLCKEGGVTQIQHRQTAKILNGYYLMRAYHNAKSPGEAFMSFFRNYDNRLSGSVRHSRFADILRVETLSVSQHFAFTVEIDIL